MNNSFENLDYVVAYNKEYQKFYDEGIYRWVVYSEEEFERNKLDIKDKFGKAENNPLLADGLHPNDEGHRLIATLLADYINKELLGK